MYATQTSEDFELAAHYLTKANKINKELKDEFSWLAFEHRLFQQKQADDGPAALFTSIESYAEKVR